MTNENKGKMGSDQRRTSKAGQKNRQMSQGGGGQPDNPSGSKSGQQSGGNYTSDRQQMADPGHRDGEHSGGGRS